MELGISVLDQDGTTQLMQKSSWSSEPSAVFGFGNNLDQRSRNTLNRVSSRRFWVHHVGTQQDKIFKLLKALEIWKIRSSQGHSLLNSKQLDKSNPRGVRLLLLNRHYHSKLEICRTIGCRVILHSTCCSIKWRVKRVQECHSTPTSV